MAGPYLNAPMPDGEFTPDWPAGDLRLTMNPNLGNIVTAIWSTLACVSICSKGNFHNP